MSAPLYNIDDVIYLLESAKIGFIESYRISEVRQDSTGSWLYKISVSPRAPIGGPTYGDRLTLKTSMDFELRESELCDYCTAVDFALAAARAQVVKLEALKASHCASASDGSGS